jgi:apolipoprotein D and lipocalin family protein
LIDTNGNVEYIVRHSLDDLHRDTYSTSEGAMIAPALLAFALTLPAFQDTSRGPVRPVPDVDLARYAGRWHEVARFPNRFQAKCARETTADYELLPGGQIRVVNACRRADGDTMRAEGRARLARTGGPASQLKVRFAPRFLSFLPFVWGDYWILDLTDDYRAALVGSPNRDYLWILSRTPRLDEATYQRMVDTAAAQGFDVARLVMSPAQSGDAPQGTAAPR